MKIPIPIDRHRPSFDETIIDLIESIAREELALSKLISSESNKIQAFVGEHLNFPTCPTTEEILTFNASVNKLMDTILMKEWLLLKKLETVTQFKSQLSLKDDCYCHEIDDKTDNCEEKIGETCNYNLNDEGEHFEE